MTFKPHKLFTFFILFAFLLNVQSQTAKKNATKNKVTKYPQSFSIQKNEFNNLFSYKANEVLVEKQNKYLNNSILLMNTKNGDMKFLKIKLNYFKNSFLLVQVNGEFSTQIFIMSDDKSIFYKGKMESEKIVLTKCTEDEIVSE